MNKSTKNTAESPFQDLPISKVFANPDQPRKSFENMEELSSSIERHGVIHPIAVVKVEKKYMIISGERRFRAVKELKEKTIKAHVMDVDAFSVQEMTLVENIQREDLTPFETAMYVNALSYRYETATELADRLGKPASYISKCRSVLNLSELIKIQLASHNHGMSFEVLQELGRVKDEHVQHELFVKKATREEIREVCRKEKEGADVPLVEVEEVSPAKEEIQVGPKAENELLKKEIKELKTKQLYVVSYRAKKGGHGGGGFRTRATNKDEAIEIGREFYKEVGSDKNYIFEAETLNELENSIEDFAARRDEKVSPAKNPKKHVVECCGHKNSKSDPLTFYTPNNGNHQKLEGFLEIDGLKEFKSYKITIEEI